MPGALARTVRDHRLARREWDDEAFREHLREIVRRKRLFREALWQKFARGLSYMPGDFTSLPPRTMRPYGENHQDPGRAAYT